MALRRAAWARCALSAAGMSMALRFWGARRAASLVRWGSLSSSGSGVKSERCCEVSRMKVRD